ncbi:hypothetical protein [Paenibacillus sp. BIC5C1]|uniref:hypothetical protein n=1 Tax=Paenibacillus sp. BIC5C1 TaxID=3078263 RepID=UPI0028E6E93C|nr:hypothetical protein [Paenibacillus sp. BIC5C1]
MPKETDRLKLPLPLGNENVTRESINGVFEKIDAGVATRDEVEALRQMMGEMDIPDASLTVKGKVRLSDKTDGKSESLVPTEKALGEVMSVAQSVKSISNNRDGYGTTTNSGNAYEVSLSPSPASYVDGLRITIKINSANTGVATINVNGLGGKSLIKPNGNQLIPGSLKVNSVYSFVYNGTAFILQGEGGEYGTADAGDVKAGKTIGTENGIVSGTLRAYGQTVNQFFNVNVAASSYHMQSPPSGFEYVAARTIDGPNGVSIRSVHSVFSIGSSAIYAVFRSQIQVYNAYTFSSSYAVETISQAVL